MRNILKTLVLSSAALCATAAFAANQARVDVPFSFTAKGHIYPAGSYDVKLDPNRNFVTMSSNLDTKKNLTWSVGPAEALTMPAVVKFDETGNEYALKSIQVGNKVTPTLNTPGKRGISATTSIGGQ